MNKKIQTSSDDFHHLIGRGFWMESQWGGEYESCKIAELHKDSYGNLVANMFNQDTNQYFDMEFESARHIENALKWID